MAAENVNNGVNETVVPLITNQDNVISGEEEIRDIYVVSEELIVAPELVTEVAAESEEEEVPEENLLEVLYDQNVELQNRVHELEEQAEERQAVVEQRDVTIQNCVTRYVMLEQNHALAQCKILKLESENSNIKDQLKEETTERVRMKDAWVKAARRVDIVERDVRSIKRRFNDDGKTSTAAPAPATNSRGGERPPVRCYRCGEEGHIRPNCSKPSKVCFSCGKDGHIARFCPVAKSSPAGTVAPKVDTDKTKSLVSGRAFFDFSWRE